MENFINAITENWEYGVGALVGLAALLRFVFKFTKNKKDDQVLEDITEALEDAGVFPDDGDDR